VSGIGLLKAAGAGSVLAIEPLAHRRGAAVRYGADRVADPGSLADDGPLVTRRAGLAEVREAFGDAARRTGLKVIIDPRR
jgi:threonine dehydrogenase-like Zn-dependent dehydrogenase